MAVVEGGRVRIELGRLDDATWAAAHVVGRGLRCWTEAGRTITVDTRALGPSDPEAEEAAPAVVEAALAVDVHWRRALGLAPEPDWLAISRMPTMAASARHVALARFTASRDTLALLAGYALMCGQGLRSADELLARAVALAGCRPVPVMPGDGPILVPRLVPRAHLPPAERERTPTAAASARRRRFLTFMGGGGGGVLEKLDEFLPATDAERTYTEGDDVYGHLRRLVCDSSSGTWLAAEPLDDVVAREAVATVRGPRDALETMGRVLRQQPPGVVPPSAAAVRADTAQHLATQLAFAMAGYPPPADARDTALTPERLRDLPLSYRVEAWDAAAAVVAWDSV